ncbi:MAG: hypothetical protein DWQ34_16765 [Planctomycetota bacterium]|nr:MAG: hypothetical protein DWQ29_23005 [Planctomycetota bacterium]REJ90753.1 MAG: hypothetical protein DWQ34_16765 [Planctomycetota bacterium]REK26701.1 MAG: hypothetical protein DWQ41_09155 [Planctomycetota bacterium]REK35638.1 MAG: hypothetical protein DWQ45_10800 [Planctomycetota bacterium]
MDQLSRLTAEQRANLVAYLDGELGESETSEIESVLAHSAVARNDVEHLARTYDLLDLLPRAKASEDFTERTMATVRMSDVRPDITQSEWYRRARRGSVLLLWTLVMAAASSVSFLVTRKFVHNDADVFVRDFEVIDRLDVYREVDSVEFLEVLSGPKGAVLDDIRTRRGRETVD